VRVLVSGARGFIGSAVARHLEAQGHEVVSLARGNVAPGPKVVGWDPAAGRLEPASLEGIDAAVHLAGEPISSRWTARKKVAIRESRVGGTALLARALAAARRKAQVLVCASAVGIYGDRGDEALTEESAPGSSFLAENCRDWEAAAAPAASAGIRVVHLRIGLVVGRGGGLLGRLVPLFRAGLGGRLGSGRQYMSWIALEDLVHAVHVAIEDASWAGPYNATAPRPVTNLEFTAALGRAVGRPTLLPAPAFALRLVFGREMAQELLLGGQRAVPARLQQSGFRFQYPELEGALRAALAH
jgi:uncharacterized protein (TIGR01777 family)